MTEPMAAIRFGCQTYAWQMSGTTYRGRLDHIVAVAAVAGFVGLEPEALMLGRYEEPGSMQALLAEHGLTLAALAYAAGWRESRETEAERAEADRVIHFLRKFPDSKLVLVQLPGPDRREVATRQRHAVSCMNSVARRAQAAGLSPTVHPNSPPGSVFRTAEDYKRLIDGLDAGIGFTPDVGHIVAGGMDPLQTVQRYRDRVDHVHFKDIADGRWAPTGEGVPWTSLGSSRICGTAATTDGSSWKTNVRRASATRTRRRAQMARLSPACSLPW